MLPFANLGKQVSDRKSLSDKSVYLLNLIFEFSPRITENFLRKERKSVLFALFEGVKRGVWGMSVDLKGVWAEHYQPDLE